MDKVNIARNKIHVIITVPHSKCTIHDNETNDTHWCDKISGTVANMIYDKFNDPINRKSIVPHIFTSQTHRTECDLNRIQCRYNDFRLPEAQLIKILTNNDTKYILLDIHSFPEDSEFRGNDVVILTKYQNVYDKLAILVRDMISKFKYKCSILEGSYENDIINTSPSSSILLEFNETLETKTLDKLSSIIAHAISTNIDRI